MKAREWIAYKSDQKVDCIGIDDGKTKIGFYMPVGFAREHARNSRLAVLVENEIQKLEDSHGLWNEGSLEHMQITMLKWFLAQAAKEPT